MTWQPRPPRDQPITLQSPDGHWWWNGQQWMPVPQQQPQLQWFTRTYKNQKQYQRDAQSLMPDGWRPVADVPGQGRITLTRMALAGPFALMWRKGGKVTVTWERQATSEGSEPFTRPLPRG